MRTSLFSTTVALALLAAGCAAEEPPAVPVWDLDVYPILRGSCSHCHGATVAANVAPASRLDICDAEPFSRLNLGTVPGLLPGAKGAASSLMIFITPVAGKRPQMPPPPGPVLSDYEFKVLERWSRRPDCTKQVLNRKPAVKIVTPLARVGSKNAVTIEVSDPDGDQVLGKAKLGDGAESADNTFLIKGAGRWAIEFNAGNVTDQLRITLFDGYDAYP